MDWCETIIALFYGLAAGISIVWNAIIAHPWVLILPILGALNRKRRY